VRRSFVAHNPKYQTCVIDWSSPTLLGLKSTKYTLSVKVQWSLWPITSSINHALSAEVWRRFCGPKVPDMCYRWKCGEVLWLITPSTKHALLAEVWRHFCGPKVPNVRYRWKSGEILQTITPCGISWSLATLLRPKSTEYALLCIIVESVAQKCQICVIVESVGKFCGP